MVRHRNRALALAIATATFGAPGFVPVAFGEDPIEEVVVTGSRPSPRSVGDSAAPIDVITGDDFGTTTNGKLCARFAITDSFAVRATASTGFRAPATKIITPEEAAELEASGIVGAGDLTEFRFFTNDFDTNTSGFDVVATYAFDWALGNTDINLAYNQTETEVESASDVIDRERKGELEDFLPETRWNLTGVHHYGNWRFLVRVSYYDDWTDPSNDPANDIDFGDEYLLDI